MTRNPTFESKQNPLYGLIRGGLVGAVVALLFGFIDFNPANQARLAEYFVTGRIGGSLELNIVRAILGVSILASVVSIWRHRDSSDITFRMYLKLGSGTLALLTLVFSALASAFTGTGLTPYGALFYTSIALYFAADVR